MWKTFNYSAEAHDDADKADINEVLTVAEVWLGP